MENNPNNKSLAKALRQNMTPWERKLWYCFFESYPIRFQRQKCIGNYIVDYYCFRAKLVIELDGGGHYNPINKTKDQNRTDNLEKFGLKVIRFSNTDVDNNFYGMYTVIDEEVKKRIYD